MDKFINNKLNSKAMNVLSDDGKKKYVDVMFTEKGYNILYNHACELTKIYFENKIYPLKLGIILGVPMMKYAQVLYKKEYLFERIKILCQMLGVNSVKAKLSNGTEIVLSITDGEQDVKKK